MRITFYLVTLTQLSIRRDYTHFWYLLFANTKKWKVEPNNNAIYKVLKPQIRWIRWSTPTLKNSESPSGRSIINWWITFSKLDSFVRTRTAWERERSLSITGQWWRMNFAFLYHNSHRKSTSRNSCVEFWRTIASTGWRKSRRKGKARILCKCLLYKKNIFLECVSKFQNSNCWQKFWSDKIHWNTRSPWTDVSL